jgi:1-acyl-sn-glycerol-3-phosphate acyltransferase
MMWIGFIMRWGLAAADRRGKLRAAPRAARLLRNGSKSRQVVADAPSAAEGCPLPVLEALTSRAVTAFARLMTGVRPDWRGCEPSAAQRIYFANHASHGDFVLIWSVLPKELRDRTRPVAGADYWRRSRLRAFLGGTVFKAVLIERQADARTQDPVEQMAAALDAGDSLILFPEGTRNMTSAPLLPFKSGLYNLALARPAVELVPTWIDNLSRVLPKGEFLPLPLLCSVTFGAPMRPVEGEDRKAFLERARMALLALGRRTATDVHPGGAHADDAA